MEGQYVSSEIGNLEGKTLGRGDYEFSQALEGSTDGGTQQALENVGLVLEDKNRVQDQVQRDTEYD